MEKNLNITIKANIDQVNVLSMLILPGNRYLVMGTKEGNLNLYDLNEGAVV